MSDTIRRAVLIIGVLVVLVGVGVSGSASSGSGGPGGSPGRTEISTASAVAVSRRGAESSAWFCAGATGTGGNAVTDMIMTNPTPKAVTGTVTTVSTTAVPVSTVVGVPAETQIGVATPATTGPSASTVVFGGGGLGVTQTVNGPLGISAAPCASTTSSHWYFADGSTDGGNTLSLSLFNPAATVAVVDVTFVTSTGLVAPPAYQGIDVPADSLVVENIGDHVQNNPDVATTVASLSGAVVAAELESAGLPGNGGPSIVLGATTPAWRWSFAQNSDVAGGRRCSTSSIPRPPSPGSPSRSVCSRGRPSRSSSGSPRSRSRASRRST